MTISQNILLKIYVIVILALAVSAQFTTFVPKWRFRVNILYGKIIRSIYMERGSGTKSPDVNKPCAKFGDIPKRGDCERSVDTGIVELV